LFPVFEATTEAFLTRIKSEKTDQAKDLVLYLHLSDLVRIQESSFPGLSPVSEHRPSAWTRIKAEDRISKDLTF
jgi:hypothetical protein